jgi:hypothetical protein
MCARSLILVVALVCGACIEAEAGEPGVPSGCFKPMLGQILAGPGAIDCGWLEFHRRSDRQRMIACARKAMASSRAYRFGSGVFGVDAGFCEAVVRASDGQIWSLRYDVDFSFPRDDPRSHPTLFVARCDAVELLRDVREDGVFFDAKACRLDDDGFERVKAALIKDG